ncbi:MAG: preprotein translocase subunit SecG [Clostridia bacterium]|nr:preprotein translocase subunit SecG [Clostridia bacterium]
MQILKIVLIVIYFIASFAVIVLSMLQSKEDAGLSSTITGSSSNNFFEKNKGNTKEGRQKRWTIILGVVLILLCLVLATIYGL